MRKIYLITLILFLLSGCSTPSNLTNQNKCSDKAREFFSDNKIGSQDNYENHYNSRLDKCYILVKHFSVGGMKDELWSPYENKVLASCNSGYDDGMTKSCNYNGSNEPYDIEKFNSFLKQHMEE